MEPIYTGNDYFVGIQGEQIIIMRPPTGRLNKDAALTLAAHIVAIADPLNERFPKILDAVKGA